MAYRASEAAEAELNRALEADARLLAGIGVRGSVDLQHLVRMLSHDFGNALSSIHLAIQSVLRDPDPSGDRLRMRLELAAKEVRRLKASLSSLQELARLAPPNLEEVLPEAVIRRALENLYGFMGEVPIPVHVHCELRRAISLDTARIVFALGEMVRYGWQSTGPSGSVTVAVEEQQRLLSFAVTGPKSGNAQQVEPKLGLLAAQAAALSHGGSLELEFPPDAFKISLVLPQMVDSAP